jgi:K+-transporting ATPase A subunit
MGLWSLLQYVLFLLVVAVLVKPVGGYLARVFNGEKTALDFALLPVERLIHKVARVDPEQEMDWKTYAISFVCSGLAGTLLVYAILRAQQFLPWSFPSYQTTALTPDLALNTAVSFSTTTTWQAYAGESTVTYFSQMVGLVAQNFIGGASGLAVGIAFIRGLARDEANKLGNFWVDLVRGTLWVLLPLSIVGSLLLIWQGVPMNFSRYTEAATLEGGTQIIAQGPVAALEFIKNLGTNGGGFFNANGAHPLANPTPLTNLLGMLAIIVLPAAMTNTFGRMVKGLFMAGLMIGRSPEYLGKLIGPPEIKLIMLYTLAAPVALMTFTAIAVVTGWGLAGLTTNGGPHGFTEILYAYTSGVANNGQNFAGLSANTPFYNVSTALAMMIGRFGLAIPALALAALFAQQRRRPMTVGSLPTDTPSFAVLVVGTGIIVGGLSYYAALCLGPIVEHFTMIA